MVVAVPNPAFGVLASSVSEVIFWVGSPRSHARWSMSPSMWQAAQAPVPVPERFASYGTPRPCWMAAGFGLKPIGISLSSVNWLVDRIEIELLIRFSTYRVCAAELSARPRGPRLLMGSTFDPCPLGC